MAKTGASTLLVFTLLSCGCASQKELETQPTNVVVPAHDPVHKILTQVEVGSPRTAVEQMLGKPLSRRYTAEGITETWVLASPTNPTLPSVSTRASARMRAGRRAARAVGFFVPGEGLAMDKQNFVHLQEKNANSPEGRRIVLIVEFKDDKVVATQEASSSGVSTVARPPL